MGTIQRFRLIMGCLLALAAVVCLWRILICDGGRIWYVPVVLTGFAVLFIFQFIREYLRVGMWATDTKTQ